MSYLLILLAYLSGSISSAILTCKVMGLKDPRTEGSHNPGATNVLRIGGKKAAAITLVGDLLKGLLPVLVGHALGLEFDLLFLVGFAAFLGHLYPLYYRFQGGKGVATAFGVYLGLAFWPGLLVCVTWLIVAKLMKISSLAALAATLLAPSYFYFFTQSGVLSLGLLLITALIYWRHRSNIKNLLNGTESSIKR